MSIHTHTHTHTHTKYVWSHTIYTYTHTHIHTHTHTKYVWSHTIHVYTHTHTHIHTHTCTCIQFVWSHTEHTHTYACTNKHTRTIIHIHTSVLTHIHAHSLFGPILHKSTDTCALSHTHTWPCLPGGGQNTWRRGDIKICQKRAIFDKKRISQISLNRREYFPMYVNHKSCKTADLSKVGAGMLKKTTNKTTWM